VVDNGIVGFLIVPFCRLQVADGLMLVVEIFNGHLKRICFAIFEKLFPVVYLCGSEGDVREQDALDFAIGSAKEYVVFLNRHHAQGLGNVELGVGAGHGNCLSFLEGDCSWLVHNVFFILKVNVI
jgi:hypothetical protein